MSQYYAIVNSTVRFPLFYWDSYLIKDSQQLRLATDNLIDVKTAFASLENLSIVDATDTEVASFNQYDGYSSINYMGVNYSDQVGGFTNELVITLTKMDLIATVERLDQQVNPVIDIAGMTLEEYKEWKIGEFSKRGEQIIFNGTEVELVNGVRKDFTYNLEDQSNLLNALFIIQSLDDMTITLPYHGHAEPCELYSALDILTIYITLQTFSTITQTMVNMRNNWVRSCETKEEVEAISFDTPLPQEWADRAEAILGPARALVEEIKRKYFPVIPGEDDGESDEGAPSMEEPTEEN